MSRITPKLFKMNKLKLKKKKLINYLFVYLQVHIKSHFIMNGVCVRFKGYIDLLKLEGVGCLEFDETRAAHEDAVLHQQIDMYKNRLREFEDKQRLYHGGQDDMEQVRRNVQGSIGVGVGGGGGMWRR